MDHVAGEFRAFRVDDGISLVLVCDEAQRRVHSRREDNAALFDFIASLLSTQADTADGT